MKAILQKFLDLVDDIRRVMKLAYEIDTRLVNAYYLTAVVGGLAPIGANYIFKYLIDTVVIKDPSLHPQSIAVLFVLLMSGYFFMRLVETIVYWGLNVAYYDYLLRNRLQIGLTTRFLTKLSSLDLEDLENPDTQNLVTQVSDVYAWEIPNFVREWNYLFSHLISIVVSVIILIPYGAWMPAIIILFAIPRIYLKIRHGNFVWAIYSGNAPQVKKLWYFQSLLSNRFSILETRIFRSQKQLLSKMGIIHDELYELNKKPLDTFRRVLVIMPILETIFILFIIYRFVPNVLNGVLSVGTFTFVVSSIERLRGDIGWGSAQFGELIQSNQFIRPFFKLLGLPQRIHEKQNAVVFKKISSPRIEFKNVSFTYPGSKDEILSDISFVIEPGENIALVGVNGAGKSTIIKLLCRFYDVTSGAILINGIDLRDLSLDNWYAHLGTLFQDFVKYNFSIRENIMLGDVSVHDEKRMMAAAQDAGAHEFITKYEHGYDQMLGRHFEDGEELSGGQWQKMAIARSFYQHAPILILDEPTSAIDAEAEFEIFQNLEKKYSDKTLLLVSHRFSTVRNAEKIIVLDKGKITEMGTHAQLLKKKGKYASMFTTQAAGYH